ncbi:MAG: hypothetical protein Kow0074_19390 [Candidatus Zixiibacteriota bacterium]
MRIISRAMSAAMIVAFAFGLTQVGASFAADKCDPAACAAKCQEVCKDTTLTEAQRLEKCKQLCAEHGAQACSAECKAKCEKAGTAACPHGAKADASSDAGLIRNASATTAECPHAKAMTAEASDAKPKVEVKATDAKAGCAATCGAEAAKACAASRKACAMSSTEQRKND